MILIVDDERRYTLPYYEHLKFSGYKVEFRKDVAVAYNYLNEHLAEIDLLILDIMMPTSNLFTKEETDNGMRTGVRFYERIRSIAPEMPVIMLTNVSSDEVQERFQNEPHCRYIVKKTCLPYELGDEVMEFLAEKNTPQIA